MKNIFEWKMIKPILIGLTVFLLAVFLCSAISGVVIWFIRRSNPDISAIQVKFKYIVFTISYIISGFTVAKYSEKENIYATGAAFFIFMTVVDVIGLTLGELKIIPLAEPFNPVRVLIHRCFIAISIFIGIKWYVKKHKISRLPQ